MDRTLKIRMGELFSGPGGIACGADIAASASKEYADVTLEHAWANDIDPNACATYRRNIHISPDSVFCMDVNSIDISNQRTSVRISLQRFQHSREAKRNHGRLRSSIRIRCQGTNLSSPRLVPSREC